MLSCRGIVRSLVSVTIRMEDIMKKRYPMTVSSNCLYEMVEQEFIKAFLTNSEPTINLTRAEAFEFLLKYQEHYLVEHVTKTWE